MKKAIKKKKKKTKIFYELLLKEKENIIDEINEKYNDIQNEVKNKDIEIIKMKKENKNLKEQLKDNINIIEKLEQKNNKLNKNHQFIKSEIKRLYFDSQNSSEKNEK